MSCKYTLSLSFLVRRGAAALEEDALAGEAVCGFVAGAAADALGVAHSHVALGPLEGIQVIAALVLYQVSPFARNL